MLLILLLLTPLLLFIYLELKHYKNRKIIDRFPGPTAIPVLGNALQVGKSPSEILTNFFIWWSKYGKGNFRFIVGYFLNIVITDVKDMEYILTSNTLTRKSDIYDMLYPWLGTGLLTGFGAKWHKHRKMITPTFHFKILQNFHEVMNKNSTKFIETLRRTAAGETIFDFQEEVHYLTLDVICDTAMGVSINAMDNKDAEVVKAFKDICINTNMRAFHPLKRKNSLYKFFPDYANYKKTLNVLQDFTNDVIKQRIEVLKNIDANSNAIEENTDEFSARHKLAFLDTLLSATIDGKPLTQREIYEEVSTFMFAGHDTTTSGISFAVYMLSRHPEIQQKVYAEQQEIMGANLKRDATFQEIADMKYLDLVIKEAQRLYPSVPFIGRLTEKDYDMNGALVPKGTAISLFIMAMGYNENHFPDPYRCDPDRFDMEKRTEKLNPFAYVPFSAGPRNCVGQKFALLELKTVVSKIVRNFEILAPLDELVSKDGYVQHFVGLTAKEQLELGRIPHKYDPILSAVLTLKSENGIQLRLRERK